MTGRMQCKLRVHAAVPTSVASNNTVMLNIPELKAVACRTYISACSASKTAFRIHIPRDRLKKVALIGRIKSYFHIIDRVRIGMISRSRIRQVDISSVKDLEYWIYSRIYDADNNRIAVNTYECVAAA